MKWTRRELEFDRLWHAAIPWIIPFIVTGLVIIMMVWGRP